MSEQPLTPPKSCPEKVKKDDAGWPLDAGDLYPCCETDDASTALIKEAGAPIDYFEPEKCRTEQGQEGCAATESDAGILDGGLVCNQTVHVCWKSCGDAAVCPAILHELCHVKQDQELCKLCQEKELSKKECYDDSLAWCKLEEEEQCYAEACMLTKDKRECESFDRLDKQHTWTNFEEVCKALRPDPDNAPSSKVGVACGQFTKPCPCEAFQHEDNCMYGICYADKESVCKWNAAEKQCHCVKGSSQPDA